MTLTEAARSLGLATSTLHHQIANRRLKARRMGRSWYVSEAEVERYRAEVSRKGKAA